ncbi:MAG: hypothetical protein ABH867_03650 [Patescibacteria group bacterium]|nr:hypothetical protein [Patescibacteria group bacterium]
MANIPRGRPSETEVDTEPKRGGLFAEIREQTFSQTAVNNTSRFFFALASQIQPQANDKEAAEKLGISLDQLNQLVAKMEASFGVGRERGESLARFFLKAGNFFREDSPIAGENIGEKLDQSSVPENINSMVAALEKREEQVKAIRANSERLLKSYDVKGSEASKIVNSWLSQQTKILEQTVREQQGIILSPALAEELSIEVLLESKEKLRERLSSLGLPKPSETNSLVEKISQQAETLLAGSIATKRITEKLTGLGLTPETAAPITKQAIAQGKKRLSQALADNGIRLTPEQERLVIPKLMVNNQEALAEVTARVNELAKAVLTEVAANQLSAATAKIIATETLLSRLQQEQPQLSKHQLRPLVTSQIDREIAAAGQKLKQKGISATPEQVAILVANRVTGERKAPETVAVKPTPTQQRTIRQTLAKVRPEDLTREIAAIVAAQAPSQAIEAREAAVKAVSSALKSSPQIPIDQLQDTADRLVEEKTAQVKKFFSGQGVPLKGLRDETGIHQAIAGNATELRKTVKQQVEPARQDPFMKTIGEASALSMVAQATAAKTGVSFRANWEEARKKADIEAVEQVVAELTGKYRVAPRLAADQAKHAIEETKKKVRDVLAERGINPPPGQIDVLVTQSIAGKSYPILETLKQMSLTSDQREISWGVVASTDPKFLAAKTAVAEEIRPVLAEMVQTVEAKSITEAQSLRIAEEVAVVLIGAKEVQGLDPKELEFYGAGDKVSLVLASNQVRLTEPIKVQSLIQAAAPTLAKVHLPAETLPYSEMNFIREIEKKFQTDLENLSITAVFNLEIREQLERYLQNRGFNTEEEAVQRGIRAIAFAITQPETDGSNLARTTAVLIDPEKEIFRSPLETVVIPQDPNEGANQFNLTNNPSLGMAFAMEVSRLPPDQLQALQQDLYVFIEYAGPERINQDPFLLNVQNQHDIIEAVYQSPLYQVAAPIIEWAGKIAKSEIVQRLAQTTIGKAVKGFGEKIISWGVEQAAKRVALEGAKQAVQSIALQGATASIAAALGIPTAGLSLAIWVGIEALKIGAKVLKKAFGVISRVAEMTGIPSTVRSVADTLTLGIMPELSNLLSKIPLIGKAAARFASSLFYGLSGMTMAGAGAALLVAFLFVFPFLTLRNASRIRKNQISTLVIGGRGGGWISSEGFPTEIIEVPINAANCEGLAGDARKACLITLVAQNCVGGMVNSPAAINALRECVFNLQQGEQLRNEFSTNELNYMLDMFEFSVNNFRNLQCVGFKRGVEMSLPDAGNAKDFANPNNISPCYLVIDPNPETPINEGVQSGDNAVWTGSTYGHIAMVLQVGEGTVLLAQAWGESGRINTTSLQTVSVSQFIRCP